VTNPIKKAKLWDAIHEYVRACGGDPAKATSNTMAQYAVVMIEDAANEFQETIIDRVHAFHQLIGQPERETPGVPDDDTVRLRGRLVIEEPYEFVEALVAPAWKVVFRSLRELTKDLIAKAEIQVDLPAAIDALEDTNYVVAGSFLQFGTKPGPVAQEVQRANMSKVGGGRDEHGKWRKPPGWTPPDIVGVLRKQGWDAEEPES